MKLPQKIKLSSLLLALTIGVNLLPISAHADNRINISDKISPQLQLAMEEAAPEEKLPVILWTQDIDHEQIARQVEIRTGLTIDNIQLDATKSLDSNQIEQMFLPTTSDAQAKEQMETLLEETEAIREQKRVMADTYVAQKRSAYTTAYHSENTKKLRSLKVSENDVVFQSEYSPMMVVNMSEDEIAKASRSAAVLSLDLCREVEVENQTVASSVQTVKANTTCWTYGLTGNGVKIGQIEVGVPNTSDSELGGKVIAINGSIDEHATNVAKFMHAVAPDAQIYSIGLGENIYLSQFYSSVETLLSYGVSVINMSASWPRTNSGDYWYSSAEQWLDHISGTHEATFVQVAGNTGNGMDIKDPGLACNIITVGAINDNHTGNTLTDDWLYEGSASGNGGSDGCAKPDVLAPGTLSRSNNVDRIGTSYAAPIVAGLAAQMMQYDSSLKTRARPVKAILSACCDRKVSSKRGVVETMEEGLTPEQGAGVVNALRMYTILSQNKYMSGNFTSEDFKTQIFLKSPCNVSATWIRENGVSNHTSGSVGVSAYQNLDLYLYSPTGEQLDSLVNMSYTEMVYRNNPTPGVYTVQLYKRDGNTNRTIWFALAWY